MKKYLLRLIIFIIPLVMLLVFTALIDPYNYFSVEKNSRMQQYKDKISFKIHYPLYKLIDFKNSDASVIILGDSRALSFSDSIMSEKLSKPVKNLAYGGGTLQEIIDTFWQANSIKKLDEVYISINFNLYNDMINMNRVSEAVNIMSSPIKYLTCRYSLKSAYMISTAYLFNKKYELEKPKMSREQFWNYQLNVQSKSFYSSYIHPDSYLSQLEKISDYCNKNDIKLVLFIPPTHVELQEKIAEFNLQDEEKQFRKEISELAVIHDFDVPNDFTKNKDNFSDPFHFKKENVSKIIDEIITPRNDL